MLTKEECLKALCRIQCGAKRNKKCEDCKCFDTKINIWKCVENTNESLIIRNLIEEHFNPKPLKFEDLKKGMTVVDWLRKIVIKIEYINHSTRCIGFEDNKGLHGLMCFDDSIFYPCNYTLLEDDEK
jgi:hypothetical protein